MGNDYLQSSAQMIADAEAGIPPMAIGEGSVVEGAIIDKNCRIDSRVRLVNESSQENSPTAIRP